MSLYTIIFIGRSGSGKGTQADLLKKYIATLPSGAKPLLYVETGDKFRAFIKGDSYSSKISEEIYKKDERQPDFLACFMWSNIFIEELTEDKHLMVDGAPRSKKEAELMDTAMKFYKREKPQVVYINVGRKWSEERLLSRGRSDDATLDKIDKRLNWFDNDTMPAIEYYKNNPDYNFIDVNGEQSIEQVHADILKSFIV